MRNAFNIQRQGGFSLVEVIVTLVLITGLYVTMMQGLAPAIAFKSKIDTEQKLKAMRSSLVSAYQDNVQAIDAVAGQVMTLSDGSTIPQKAANAAGRCTSESTTFTPIARYLDGSASRAHTDGFNQPMCFLITPRQTMTIDGIALNYHSFALVSPGKDGEIHANTKLTNAGELILDGDDIGILLDGRAFIHDRLKETLATVRRASAAYHAYFQARYQADANRALSTNYFSCGALDCSTANVTKWDSGGQMPVLGSGNNGDLANLNTASGRPYQILGLSISDVTDGFGGVISIQNRGNLVRNPNNASASMVQPPYTALIYSTIPGGIRVEQTVVGTP